MPKNSPLLSSRVGASVQPLLVVLLLLIAGIAYGAWKYIPSEESDGPDVITATVEQGPFTYDVVERGEVESSNNVEVRCEVRAQKSSSITILEVVDEGTNVKKGDVLVRLDSSGLEQDLIQQQINLNSAEAQMITSKNLFEAAKIAKKEYVEGTFFQEEQQIQAEIFIAEEALRRAQEYLFYSERLAARGYVTAQQLEGDRFAVEKARTELKTAKTKLRVLQEYTKPKTLKTLDSDIASTEAAWRSDESSYKLEVAKLKDIEVQIEKCVLLAPQDGQVIHANETGRRGDNEFIVEPGASVREGQAIIRLPESNKMQVKAKISESRIADLEEELPATIRIDAFGDKNFRGRVIRVNEYPEPTSWYSSQVKEYGCFIQFLETDDTLKPGLTAEVTIHVAHVKDAIKVPVQAVHEHGRKTYCMVQSGEDWDAREVEIAADNSKFVMIKQGITPGDVVALDPRAVLELVSLPEIVEENGIQLAERMPTGKPGGANGKRRGDGQGNGQAGGPGAKSAGANGMQPKGPGGPAGPGGGQFDATKIADAIFSRTDKNKDGKLSSDELTSDQSGRMKQYDSNGDGLIDKSEVVAGLKQRAKG